MTQVVAYDTAARNTMRRLTENPTTLDLSFGKIGVRGAVAAAERCASPLSVSYGHVGCFEGKGLSTLRSSNSSRTQYALGRRRHLSGCAFSLASAERGGSPTQAADARVRRVAVAGVQSRR